mmetsp:Transcript_69553/g.214999  ORF Transcript_69553/g.214999 Transcript_69553/m.214999 type:complete len:210 (-) Transcript_69553:797-1426(-)
MQGCGDRPQTSSRDQPAAPGGRSWSPQPCVQTETLVTNSPSPPPCCTSARVSGWPAMVTPSYTTRSTRAPAELLPATLNGVGDLNGSVDERLRMSIVLMEPICLAVPHGLLPMVTASSAQSQFSTRMSSKSQLLRLPPPPWKAQMMPSTADGRVFSLAMTSLSRAVTKPTLSATYQLSMNGQPFSICQKTERCTSAPVPNSLVLSSFTF